MTITLVFEKNANFFHKNLPKIAENCDLNIDPWPQLMDIEHLKASQALHKIANLKSSAKLLFAKKIEHTHFFCKWVRPIRTKILF
jgi:hypothetical protein